MTAAQAAERDSIAQAMQHVGELLDTRLGRVETDVAALRGQVNRLEGQVNRLEESTARGFDRIETRLEQLVALVVRDETRPAGGGDPIRRRPTS